MGALVVEMAASSTRSAPPSRRRSHFIPRKTASNIHHAVGLAAAINKPFTHFISINFEKAGVAPDAAHSVFQKLRDAYFGQWCRRPGRNSGFAKCTPTFAWVREAVGAHGAHWLVHVPRGRERDFMERLPKWLRAVAGQEVAAEALKIGPAYKPSGAKLYMLKGIDPVYADFYGVRHIPQGVIDGKRAGVSQNLGPSAKRRMREAGSYPRARVFPRRSFPSSPAQAVG